MKNRTSNVLQFKFKIYWLNSYINHLHLFFLLFLSNGYGGLDLNLRLIWKIEKNIYWNANEDTGHLFEQSDSFITFTHEKCCVVRMTSTFSTSLKTSFYENFYFNKVTVLLHLRMRNVVWSERQALFARHSRPLSVNTYFLFLSIKLWL